MVGIVGHMKHRRVLHRPYLALLAPRAIHQHRMPLIDAAGDLSVPAGAENWRGTRIRVHTGEIRGRQWEAALPVMDLFRVVEEEGTHGFIESSLFPAKDQGAEFEAGIHVREEGW